MLSCRKEESTNFYAYLKNTTTHKIEVKPYFSGIISSDKVVTLLAGESKQIGLGTDRGIVGNVGFNSQFSGSDSLIVIFDNLYSITHYANTPNSFASKFYLATSLRSLRNKNSYSYSYRDLSKYQRENEYLYTFVEQDYLDAR